MASTDASTQGQWSLDSLLNSVQNTAVSWANAKIQNMETPQSSNNVPDIADQRTGQAQAAASNSTGGSYQPSVGGLPTKTWLMIGGLAIAGMFVAKRVL